MDKRGISPLIATVLIIGFTIVIAAIVITFGTNLVKTTTEETQRQATFGSLCTGVEFNIKAAEDSTNPGRLKVTIQNENTDKLAGLVVVLKNQDNQATVISSVTTVVESTQGAPPFVGLTTDGSLGPFSTATLVWVQGSDFSQGEVEARAIVSSEDGEMQACTSPTKAKIPIIN